MPFHFCPQELMAIMAAIPFIAVGYSRVKNYLACKVCKNNKCEQTSSKETESQNNSDN